jgi:hypothetical protein
MQSLSADNAGRHPTIRTAAGIHVSIVSRLIMHTCMNVGSIYDQQFMRPVLKLFNAIYCMVRQDSHTFGTRAMKEAEHRMVLCL